MKSIKKMVLVSAFAGTCLAPYAQTTSPMYNSVKNEIKKNGRIKGFWLNVFPPLERMKFTFPFLKKMPVFLPFCWVARCFFAIVTKPDKVLRKIRYVVRASREMEE